MWKWKWKWKWKRRLALAAAACWLAWPAAALPASQRQPLLVLDAGHSPTAPGALGVRGVHELAYNDRLVAQLAAALQKDGWRVRLTRQSGQEMALGQRPALANRLKADVFLSIHHDSAQLQFLEKKQTENGEVYEATRPIRGYSLFVSGQNPQFRNSYCLAESLGEEILALGRPPTLHHAEAVEGENRPLLHQRLGIYQYDGLAVLRKTAMPAVLLEAGVLVDRTDEAYVSNPHNQQALVEAVTRALRPWRERLARSLAGQRLTPCEAAAALPEPEIKPEAKPEKKPETKPEKPGKKP